MYETLPNRLQSLVVVLLSAAATIAAATQNDSAKKPVADNHEAILAGDWHGDSICLIRESACHDEDSLYHFTGVAGKPGAYSLRADKIVNGQPVNMGTLDCTYDTKEQALQCINPNRAVLRFTWQDKEMRGTMTLTDKTPWRKLTLRKVGP